MTTVADLENPDRVRIDGETYVVVRRTSIFHSRGHTEMAVGLVKPGQSITPMRRLVYMSGSPEKVRLEAFSAGSWKKVRMQALKLDPVMLKP